MKMKVRSKASLRFDGKESALWSNACSVNKEIKVTGLKAIRMTEQEMQTLYSPFFWAPDGPSFLSKSFVEDTLLSAPTDADTDKFRPISGQLSASSKLVDHGP